MSFLYYIFDMDGTLTESQGRMRPDYSVSFLRLLEQCRKVVIISGATSTQMDKQVPFKELHQATFRLPPCGISLYKMSQNGNVVECNGRELCRRKLTLAESLQVCAHADKIRKAAAISVSNDSDLIQNRGAQISYSLLGHNEDRAKKRAFDPKGKFRKELLALIPFHSETMTVKIGGTTCLDYVPLDGTKAANLRRHFPPVDLARSVYVGDQLYDGGNDSDVRTIDGLTCVQVSGPNETFEHIAGWLRGK